ncbi:ABC transporter permease [Cohnella sp. AR92]|nr:ABC transporter permease [Cohnella sp. AR92]
MYPLVCNETIKMMRKRRFLVIVLILLVLIPIFSYAQMRISQESQKQLGTSDWRLKTEQQVKEITNRLSGSRTIPGSWRQQMELQVKQLQYALDKNINPATPNGVTFTREFMINAIGLFLPLMVAVIAADLVSGEQSAGTIKLLLTRPVSRWRILLSKLLTLIMFTSLIVLLTGIFCYLIGGGFFGYRGWTEPVLSGFRIIGDQLDTSAVRAIPQWRFILMEFGLAWFSCVVVACLSLMVSVLVRSTAAAMGIMMAALIAGSILSAMASSWHSAKYLFMINLQTTDFLTGSQTPVPGLTIGFSLAVLGIWALAGLIIAFAVFTRRDILN